MAMPRALRVLGVPCGLCGFRRLFFVKQVSSRLHCCAWFLVDAISVKPVRKRKSFGNEEAVLRCVYMFISCVHTMQELAPPLLQVLNPLSAELKTIAFIVRLHCFD